MLPIDTSTILAYLKPTDTSTSAVKNLEYEKGQLFLAAPSFNNLCCNYHYFPSLKLLLSIQVINQFLKIWISFLSLYAQLRKAAISMTLALL